MANTVTKNAFGKLISNYPDLIYGTSNDDIIDGKGGDDIIKAGRGNDLVIGGAGNDLLSGGYDFDTFAFDFGHGGDKITDFTAGEDRIELRGQVDGYYAFLNDGNVRLVTLDQVDDGSWVKAGSITLVGMDAAEWFAMTGEELDTYEDSSTWDVTSASNQTAAATNDIFFV